MVQHYLTHAGDKLDEDTLKQLLDAETWLSAEEAMGMDFVMKLSQQIMRI